MTKSLIAKRVERQENRLLVWGDNLDYHVIADLDTEISVGDTVIYEPGGFNFGWFVGVKKG